MAKREQKIYIEMDGGVCVITMEEMMNETGMSKAKCKETLDLMLKNKVLDKVIYKYN